jgi:hypothetical protein
MYGGWKIALFLSEGMNLKSPLGKTSIVDYNNNARLRILDLK